jgi:CubicO group peptidase (beta-lactamase class C family)
VNLTRRDLLAACAASVLAPSAGAQDAPAETWLDRAAAQLREELEIPAVWLAGAVNGDITAGVSGVRKHGDPTPAAVGDKLMIASISKPMIGLWIASLVQQGKVDYGMKLLDVVPELRDDCLPQHQNITLAQLLTHTAGVRRDHYPSVPHGTPAEQMAFRLSVAKEAVSTPGPNPAGQASYSNAGHTTGVLLVERAAGVNYNVEAAEFFRTRVGLSSWGTGSPNPKDDLSQPWHHRFQGGGRMFMLPSRQDHVSIAAYPSGGIHLTMRDLARFGQVVLDLQAGRNSLLRPETVRTMMEARPNTDRTLGSWTRAMWHDSPIFGHGGALIGLTSYLEIIPDLNIVYAYVVTSGWGAPDPPDVIGKVRAALRDPLRMRRARTNRPPACEMALTSVQTMDKERKQEITPTREDDKVRVNVRFSIAGWRTGDLQVVATLGEKRVEQNFFRGIAPGNHLLHFDFDVPKTPVTPFELSLDALGTSGNRTPAVARMKSELRLA